MKEFDLLYGMGLGKVLGRLTATIYVIGSFSWQAEENRLLFPENSYVVLGMRHFSMDMYVPIKVGLLKHDCIRNRLL